MPRPLASAVSSLWTREFHIDLRPLVRLARERPEAVLLGLGTLLRVVTYLWNRAMWLDERSLKGNIVGVPILDFSAPLWQDQLAPLGFLILERAMATFLGSRNYVLRSLPMAAGLAALFLFERLAGRVLPRRAALVALALFAFSDDLVYYASEFKPYSLDLAFGLAIALQSAAVLGGSPTARRIAWLAILLAAAPWFSFASAFVVAGCGLVLLVDALAAGHFRIAMLWVAMALAWLGNLHIAYRASHALLSPYTTMYVFWDFAFLPLRFPLTTEGLFKSIGLILEVFVNPLNLLSPGGSRFGVVLPLVLLIAGGIMMGRRSPRIFLLLAAPIALALGASVARYYPFHGRLILELVPFLFILVAQGIETISRPFASRSGIAYKTLLIALLTFPCWDACINATSRHSRDFNRHGDLHPNVFIDIPE